MPHVEYVAIERKIEDTKKAIIEATQCDDKDLQALMTSELYARLDSLEKEKEAMKEVDEKETVSLRIYGEKIEPGKVSSRILLSALNGFQSMVDSIANATFHSPTSRGKIPERVKSITDFAVVGVFAGSFGITLERPVSQCGLTAETDELDRILHELFSVLETTDNGELLLKAIAPYGKRTVSHYRQWISSLQDNDVDLEVDWTDTAANIRKMHLKKEKASSIISTLNTIEKIDHADVTMTGILNGINIRNHTFEMSVDDIGIIKGNALPEMLMSISERIGAEIYAHLTKSISFTKAGVQYISWYLSSVD